MPRKPGEGAPLEHEGKMSDETRREVLGGSGKQQEKGKRDPEEEADVERHSSGPSPQGSANQPQHPHNT